jgi:hypothetical protein
MWIANPLPTVTTWTKKVFKFAGKIWIPIVLMELLWCLWNDYVRHPNSLGGNAFANQPFVFWYIIKETVRVSVGKLKGI